MFWVLTFLFLCSFAYGSEVELGVKLFKDGMYSLAAKTFKENLGNLSPDEFKKDYKYILISFLKTKDYGALKEFKSLWEKKFPNFERGELLAVRSIVVLKEGKKPEQAFAGLENLSVEEKISFFKVLLLTEVPEEAKVYLIKLARKNLEVKGALKDSGLLKKFLEEGAKNNDYRFVDLIFDTYGRWFSSSKEALQYVKYLERKKRYPEALIEAQKLFKKYPKEEVRTELARAYYLNGKFKEAAELLKNPKTLEERYLLAWSLYKLGKVSEIPKVIGLNVSKPEEPEKLKVLEEFYGADFELQKLRKYFPELYAKALIFSFSSEFPKAGSPADIGYSYYEKGLYGEAEEQLKKAVQNPTNDLITARTLYLLGKVGTVNAEVGNVVYNQLASNYQNTPYYKASLLDAAKVYLFNGNPQVAVKLLKYFCNQFGKNRGALKLLGTAYFNLGEFKSAEKYLKKLEDGESLTRLAYAQYRLGDKKGALKTLERELKTSSLFPEINGGRLVFLSKELDRRGEIVKYPLLTPTVRAMAAAVSGNVDFAEKVFPSLPQREKLALSLFLARAYEEKNPQKSMFYLNFLLNMASDEEVEKYAKQYINYLAYKSGNFEPLLFNDPYFIAYNPENVGVDAETLLSKASDYEKAGEYGKAYGLLKIALSRVGSKELKNSVAVRMVTVDLKQRNFERALKDVSLISDEDLKNYFLFKIFLKEGKLVDAYTAAQNVKDFEKIPQKEKGFFIGKLAHYYKLIGKKDRALKLAEELCEGGYVKTTSYDDLISLAVLAQDKGKTELAEKLINAAVSKAKTNEQKAESLFWKASVEAQKGELDRALIDYMKVAYEVKVEPWSSTSLYRAAQLLERKGQYRQAIKLYRKVAEMKKGTKEGEVAEEKVKSLLRKLKK
jgi:tetratricopeptide (TPR) repeat protein